MKKEIIAFCMLLAVTAGTALHAQADQDAAMKAWQAYMTPGDAHKLLASADGDWTYESTMWMAPGAAPEKTNGAATNRMVMGGRYQESKFSGTMMGMPFEGFSLTGYDNARKIFQSSWIDNLGTGLMQMEGKMDPATKTIQFNGKMTDPATGKEVKVRETFAFIDDNTQKMEMFDSRGGKEFKTMEIIFKRKK